MLEKPLEDPAQGVDFVKNETIQAIASAGHNSNPKQELLALKQKHGTYQLAPMLITPRGKKRSLPCVQAAPGDTMHQEQKTFCHQNKWQVGQLEWLKEVGKMNCMTFWWTVSLILKY